MLNVICPGRISPIAKAVQSVLPAADDPEQPTNTSKITNNAVSYSRSESKARVPSIKGDYVINDKQRVSFMYGGSWTPAQPCISAIKGVPCNSWPSDQSTKYYRLNHDYIFTPNLLNHVTIGFNKRFVIENPDNINGLNDDWRKAIQIPGTTRGGKPGKGTEYNTEYFRTPVRVDTDSRQRTTSIKEQVAWLQGKHSVKFGFDYIRNFYRRLDCVGCAGSINFNQTATGNPGVSGRTGGGYAAFLLGVADSSNFSFSGDIAYQMPYYAWYVQDDFKVTRKLTMNIGLRYDLSIPKQEVNFQNSNLNFSLANPAAGGLLGAMEFAGDGTGPERQAAFWGNPEERFRPPLGDCLPAHTQHGDPLWRGHLLPAHARGRQRRQGHSRLCRLVLLAGRISQHRHLLPAEGWFQHVPEPDRGQQAADDRPDHPALRSPLLLLRGGRAGRRTSPTGSSASSEG